MDIALGVVSATGENILCNAVTKEKIEKYLKYRVEMDDDRHLHFYDKSTGKIRDKDVLINTDICQQVMKVDEKWRVHFWQRKRLGERKDGEWTQWKEFDEDANLTEQRKAAFLAEQQLDSQKKLLARIEIQQIREQVYWQARMNVLLRMPDAIDGGRNEIVFRKAVEEEFLSGMVKEEALHNASGNREMLCRINAVNFNDSKEVLLHLAEQYPEDFSSALTEPPGSVVDDPYWKQYVRKMSSSADSLVKQAQKKSELSVKVDDESRRERDARARLAPLLFEAWMKALEVIARHMEFDTPEERFFRDNMDLIRRDLMSVNWVSFPSDVRIWFNKYSPTLFNVPEYALGEEEKTVVGNWKKLSDEYLDRVEKIERGELLRERDPKTGYWPASRWNEAPVFEMIPGVPLLH